MICGECAGSGAAIGGPCTACATPTVRPTPEQESALAAAIEDALATLRAEGSTLRQEAFAELRLFSYAQKLIVLSVANPDEIINAWRGSVTKCLLSVLKPLPDIEYISTESAAAGPAAARGPKLIYFPGIFTRCTLPHTDPAENKAKKEQLKRTDAGYHERVQYLREHEGMDRITRRNGNIEITAISGRDKITGELLGLPVNSTPRILLAYAANHVMKGGSRKIYLGKTWGECLTLMGQKWRGGRQGIQAKNDLKRLLAGNFTITRYNVPLETGFAVKYELWDETHDPDDPDSMEGGWFMMSEDCFSDILAHSPPYSLDALKALQRSPIAMDAYMIVSNILYRFLVPGSKQHCRISYSSMQCQLGTGIADDQYRKFRHIWAKTLHRVANEIWAPVGLKLKIDTETERDYFTIYASPLLVTPKPSISIEARSQILRAESFESAILERAKRVAPPGTDIAQLQQNFFISIRKKHDSIVDPICLFLHLAQFEYQTI